MARIPENFTHDLLARTDLVELIDARVPLKKTGRNYSACCPFHQEKTPSFTVAPDKQFYYCFGCGASGNAVGFLMEYEHLSFPEAVKQLASRAGMEVPESRPETAADRQKKDRLQSLYDLLSRAEDEGIVRFDGHRVRFSHPLLVQGVYAGATASARRTMHRRLADEGHSWQKLLDQVRLHQARQLLCQSPAPQAEIAEALGYSDIRSFQRSFKRHTGMTPGQFRTQQKPDL